jgi:methyl-accepting chemotaxis protein
MAIKLKLKNQMLVGYTIPLLIYVAIAGMVYSTAKRAVDTFEDVERVQEVVTDVNILALGTQGMVRSVRGYLLIQNENFITDYTTSLESAIEAATDVKPLIVLPEQQKRLDRMIELIKQYGEGSEPLLQLVREGKREEAIAIVQQGDLTKLVEEFDEVSNEFLQQERTLLSQETGNAKSALSALVIALVVGTVALIILAVGVALLISSKLTGTINRAITAIASSSNEIAATVEQQARVASQQATSVHQTTTTMDELGASSQQSAQQAEIAAASASQVSNLAEAGSKAIEQTLERMGELKLTVGNISDQILRLNEQTGQIGNISNLVSNLANQTNMLALNAAVEAVRAGEHGKGFAVVAAEIRKLADQSKQSAEKINGLVDDIQSAISSTVIATDQGTKTVEKGVETAQGTVITFLDVSDAIGNVVLSSQQISLNVKQQAIAIQQVVEAMNALNKGATESANGITQTRIGTQQLKETAQNLQSIV